MQVGIDMLNWNELQVGDLVDVDAEFNSYPRTRIIQKLDDVSRESGLLPGPGFIGTDQYGDEFVFSVQDVIPSSYGKYAMSENRQLSEFFGKKKKEASGPKDPVSQKNILGIGDVKAAWTWDGLTMEIYVDDKLAISIHDKNGARDLVSFLNEIIEGPMRSS
jgi:hypothetical protein